MKEDLILTLHDWARRHSLNLDCWFQTKKTDIFLQEKKDHAQDACALKEVAMTSTRYALTARHKELFALMMPS